MSHPVAMSFNVKGRGVSDYLVPVEEPGVGEESNLLTEYTEDIMEHYLNPLSSQWADPSARFHGLKSEWQEATAALSSLTNICMHPAYQQIIGMGPVAIPLIMNEMKRAPHHWFWALKSITGEDPVPPDLQGRMIDMTNVWLIWWSEHRYSG